ncbi:General secretion pathway protein M [Polaromonas sp. CG9_12]|uniref:type II secretion system protein GspM n=1 Tax=Polaromonas sp. CG_9.11 TaxID=2787730 RepID=UPI0004DDC4DD|nr:type II secretion system protein GspM [Polaromonas sp. CG_9.11]MBG6074867.1 general secretion pathway protein M [Polaromonas sp. CG_9.11]CDS53768.1 General secretion pathway protein M [Polaromonas sp. CG9_12]
MSLTSALEPLRARWVQLPGREKNGIRLAGLLVLAIVLWQFSIRPALGTLRTADAQARVLDAQLQTMQAMQLQAQAVQKQPPLGFDEAVRALTATTKQTLGASAQLVLAGERASITVKDATPDALAEWLTQARLNARSALIEARLVRASTPGGPVWNGVLVMGLPAR